MKKIILTVIATIFVSNVNAQEILEKITKEVCSCIDAKKDKIAETTGEELKMQLGLCILSSYTAHEKEINKDYGNVIKDEAAMEKFGEDIGMKMITVCPETLMAIAGSDEEVAEEEVADLKIEGKVTEIKIGQFATIVVKDKNDRVHNFLLLDYFDTASLFTNGDIKKNDSILVSYSEIELYDPTSKEFRYFKVISGLEKK